MFLQKYQCKWNKVLMKLHEDMQEFCSGGMLSPQNCLLFCQTSLNFIIPLSFHKPKNKWEWLILLKGCIQWLTYCTFVIFAVLMIFEEFRYIIQSFCSHSSVPNLFWCLHRLHVSYGEKAHIGGFQIFPTSFVPFHKD